MKQTPDELKLLLQELKDPYKQLNFVVLLISVIPVLSCLYILFGGTFSGAAFRADLVPVLFFSNLIIVLGYWVGYRIIHKVLRKILAYATRARRSEQLRASMAVALAHDLKGPLAVIKANMANLKEGLLGPLTAKQEEMASLCSGVADRTAAILTDLIKSYSPGEESSALDLSHLDLQELVEQQLREIAAVAQAKNISLKAEPSRTPLPLNADRSMILRVINNLLNNAVKYTPVGGKISVRAYRTEGFAQLDVLNTGTPIPEDRLERIFETYERLDRSVEGEGLGLSIARGIVEAHQGKVWAESLPGKPICFTVLLPLAKNAS